MNIGIVTTWFERGAAYVSRQYKDLFEKEHSVFIFARGGEKQAKNNPQWDGPEVFWARRFYRDPTEINLKEFGKWIGSNKIDMVFFNEQRWWDAVLFCKENNILSGSYIDYYTEETIPLHGLYDFLICNTKRHLSAFEWHPQVYFIPWGTDLELFKPAADISKEKYPVFFHSAGMAPHRKGSEQVVYAFADMKNEKSKLIIHTQIDLEKRIPETIAVIKELKKQNRLEIINKTVAAPGLYHLGDVYVYPSHLEGIGLTIAEALSCGLPIITVDFPPMNEFADSSISTAVPVSRIYSRSDGYYWPKNDVDIGALSKAMDKFCLSRKKLNELKKKARIYAQQYLDWDKNSVLLLEKITLVRFTGIGVKHKAEKYLASYKKKYERNLKTLVRDYWPSLYSGIHKRIK